MRRISIILAMLMIGMAGQAQRGIDMNVVRKAMKQQHGMMNRNDIAPIKANYQVNNNGTLLQYRDDFEYDEYEYYLTKLNTAQMNNGNWEPYMETTYEVDWNYCPIEAVTVKWDGSYWMNNLRVTYQYEEVGFIPFIKEEVHEIWGGNNWVNLHKYVYDYDPLVTVIIKDWNGNTWENHYLYTIETELNQATILLQYWQGGAWQNQERSILTLNAQGNEETITITEWQNATWVNEEQHTYEYDANGYLSKIFKRSWENGSWSNTNYQTLNYTSDGMGNSTNVVCRVSGNAELNTDVTMYYNEGESIDYEQVQEISMDYIDLTEVQEHATMSHFNVFPNPTEGRLEIRGEQFLKVVLYNLTGQKVLESENNILELKALSSGAYLLKIHRTDGIDETQKILVK